MKFRILWENGSANWWIVNETSWRTEWNLQYLVRWITDGKQGLSIEITVLVEEANNPAAEHTLEKELEALWML